MAQAPRPGAARVEQSARQFLRIRLRDQTLDVNPNPTLTEKVAVRYATGLPIEAFLNAQDGSLGEDSVAVLWWLGRRQNGEPALAFKQAAADWPSDLTEDDLEIDVIDLDAEPAGEDSPEGVGPAS